MRLKDEIPFVVGKMAELSRNHDIGSYIDGVRKAGDYRSLRTRVAWDLLRAACGTGYICGLYDKYGCNDSHIGTLAISCMERIGVRV